MALVSESLGDLDVLYEKIEKISTTSNQSQIDELNKYIDETLTIFSSTFLLMCFAMYYFYKLISESVKSFVNKFFPDAVFGDSSPMHDRATKATGRAKNIAMKMTGAKYITDVMKHKTSQGIKGGSKKLGAAVGRGVNAAAKKLLGKGGSGGGGSEGGGS